MAILIIANARYKGGLSGSDAIYESFKRYWPQEIDVWTMMRLDFKPFAVCYVIRIILALIRATLCMKRYKTVYSASDFLMDSLPALIMKMKGSKWVAGFFLFAKGGNVFYRLSQAIARPLIEKFSDMMIVTNESMYGPFASKKKTWINGGIELSKIPSGSKERIYDAVFCGRIHPSKGIDDLIYIWYEFRKIKPEARLALIGDGDLGVGYLKKKGVENMGVELLGYMGDERFEVFQKSKLVLYPAKIDHFSIAPVEAMACGCPMITYDLPAIRAMKPQGALLAKDRESFVDDMVLAINHFDLYSSWARAWARKWSYKKQSLRVYSKLRDEGMV